MATQLTNYQCPACTGPLHFDGASGKLVCDFCGSSYDTAEIEALYAEKEAAAETAAQNKQAPPPDSVWSENEAAGLRSYSCPSCGAELICDETTAATSCPYCGNPTVIAGQFSGMQRPELVLPFVLDKNAAKAALKKYYRGKRFLPNAFSSQNHIEEIKGVYVPFWLFDANASGSGLYEATTSSRHRNGDYVITTTKHYDVRRAAMYLKVLRYSYSSSGKSYASQPFDIRKLFELITQLQDRMANVVVENQDFETLIKHYDRPDAFFYADPPYFSTEDMYEVGFGWDDHVRLRDTLKSIKGKFLLSYNDCPEIRELYEGFSLFDFSRTHSMAQRYEAGKEFKELLIGNYDLYERERGKPRQLPLFNICGIDEDYEKILKECIISCKIKN